MRRRSWLTATLGLGASAGLLAWGRTAQAPADAAGLQQHVMAQPLFGTQARLSVLHADAGVARRALALAFDELRQVQAQMSLHTDDSALVQLNRDGRLAAPPAHLLEVVRTARQLSQATGGAFDATVQPLWQLHASAQASGGLPGDDALAVARALVGWQGLEVSATQLRLARPGMAVTLNGLAQGYGADVALRVLRSQGIEHALLDTGEFGALGRRADAQPWRLGVRHPRQAGALAASLRMDGRFVSTSGDYETAFTDDFSRHHIFDPTSGLSPAELASATVLAPTGIMADGLSTALLVMGAEAALKLCERLPGVDALLIGKDGRRWASSGLPVLEGPVAT